MPFSVLLLATNRLSRCASKRGLHSITPCVYGRRTNPGGDDTAPSGRRLEQHIRLKGSKSVMYWTLFPCQLCQFECDTMWAGTLHVGLHPFSSTLCDAPVEDVQRREISVSSVCRYCSESCARTHALRLAKRVH